MTPITLRTPSGFLMTSMPSTSAVLDVALGAAHVALRREARVDAAKEDRPVAHLARGEAHLELVAEPDARDVALLDVGADPEIVGVDQRHDRRAGGYHLAGANGAHVDDAVQGRMNLRIGEADVGLRGLRGGGGALLLRAHQRAPLHRHLLGLPARELERGALRVRL